MTKLEVLQTFCPGEFARKGTFLMDFEIRRCTDDSFFEMSPVIARFGTWVVTTYGVECLTIPYFFEYDRVNEDDWLRHMSGKTWVIMIDFETALEYARLLHERKKPRNFQAKINRPDRSVRFSILKRDGYRCQICGISAKQNESVRLEVDHKVARANGGTNHKDNLWVLCFDCNRGKRVEDL